MNQVTIDYATSPKFSPTMIESMFHLREQVFKGRLGWEVSSVDGQEKDVFDDLNPVYMLSSNKQKQTEGCCRLLPTVGPYMLKDVFPQLLRGEELPVDENIWELSRLAVSSKTDHYRLKANLNEVTLDLLRGIYDFAIENNIDRYVVVTTAAIERLLKHHVGLPMQRFGDGKLTKVGKEISVCTWVDINEQYRRAVYSPYQLEKEAA